MRLCLQQFQKPYSLNHVDIADIVDNVDIVDFFDNIDIVDIVDIVDVVNIAHTKYWYCCVNLKHESWWIPRLCAISKTLITQSPIRV